MLVLQGLEVVYNNAVRVLNGVSLTVDRGEVVCLLGANGAGKTTTLRAASGLLALHHGRLAAGGVTIDGDDVTHLSAPARVERGVVQVLEGRGVFPELTVELNLRAGAHLTRADRDGELEFVYGLFPALSRVRKRQAGFLSGGEQQMLAIGRALMTRPSFLLLDEPSLGLAPTVMRTVFETIGRLARGGTGILLVEQNARAALRASTRGYVLENGRVVMDNDAQYLAEDDDIREFYLGVSGEGRQRRYSDVRRYKRQKRWVS